jgi:hypothetical protein
MSSRILELAGFFVGNLIYRSVRDGGVTWTIVFDSMAVALIMIGLLMAFDKLRKSKQN